VKIVQALIVLTGLAVGWCVGTACAQQSDTPATAGAEYFNGVIIYANDVERSVKFYTDVMGLKTVGRVERDGHLVEVLLSKSGKLLDGAILTLQPTNNDPQRSDPNRLKFGTILFMTSSNKAMGDQLRVAGYQVTERDAEHLLTKDPDGHNIMIYQVSERLKQSGKSH
jgi:catechol 2,3-dioxygenase-like lactoylglutathione lyase family enzyme